MTSTQLASDYRTKGARPERQLAAAIILKALDDLTTARYCDEARQFLFSSDSESVSSREYWLMLAGLPLDCLERFKTIDAQAIRARLRTRRTPQSRSSAA